MQLINSRVGQKVNQFSIALKVWIHMVAKVAAFCSIRVNKLNQYYYQFFFACLIPSRLGNISMYF